jgi:phosphoglycerate dehydrogenase-like enzyme
MFRVAILDDYQQVALQVTDWSPLAGLAELTCFSEPFRDQDKAAVALAPFDGLVAMRERTPLPGALLQRLPRLQLLVTTGMRNSAVDLAAAARLGVVVAGTRSLSASTVEHTWTLILASARNLVVEAHNMSEGRWQTTLGSMLAGRTLGVVGLGRIGSAVARVGGAFGMRVIAWSENLTTERAEAAGAELVSFDELLSSADVITLHQVLSDRTRHLIGERELALMGPQTLLVNTSRGAIVSTDALVNAVSNGRIAGAAVDVYEEEPLPVGHPLRHTPGILATPHVGYVTREVYEVFYGDAVEDIAAFLKGEPIRVLTP